MEAREQEDLDLRKDEATEAISRGLVGHVSGVAAAVDVAAIFVYAGILRGEPLPLPDELQQRAHYGVRNAAEQQRLEGLGLRVLRVPKVSLTRIGQVNMMIFLALSHRLVRHDDVVLCLAGPADGGGVDSIFVKQIGRDFESYSSAGDDLPPSVLPEVLDRVMHIASELGSEGREGRPVGALFVVGDADRVISMTRQLILNPFRGYEEPDRNILAPGLEETIKELATIDGAFVLRGDGVVETCGAYLKTAGQEEYQLPPGLGARHHAAAAITAVSDSVSVTVSESTGTVMAFRGGRLIAEIEKPRSFRQPTRR